MIAGLLFKLAPCRSEGPNGYLLRLAEANKLKLNDLGGIGVSFDAEALARHGLMPDRQLDPDLWRRISSLAVLKRDCSRVWNSQNARFCPLCLQESGAWQAEWELCFYDACASHAVWMIDRCSSCSETVSWNRSHLMRCSCGADFRAEVPQPAPDELRWLSAVILTKLIDDAADASPVPLRGLNVDETQRLIRYLGLHLDPAGSHRTTKLDNVGRMDISWPVTSVAAAILSDWPHAFHARFSALHERFNGQKMGAYAVFRAAHHHIFNRLKGPAFDSVRDAYNQWLVENWRGGLNHRNRTLNNQLLEAVKWIPASEAAGRLGVGVKRLRRLVAEGTIDGQETYSSTGRRFLSVWKQQVDQLAHSEVTEVDMTTAAEQLGLGKMRMRELLRLLFPSASRPTTAKGVAPWRIPRHEVERYLAIGEGLPVSTIPEESQVSFFHVLKYWAWGDQEIIDLVEAVREGQMPLEGVLEGSGGLARWLFDAQALKLWRRRRAPDTANWFSVPQIAKLLGVKQEVAYWMVRTGIIEAETLALPWGGRETG